jgi:hypothetical protein
MKLSSYIKVELINKRLLQYQSGLGFGNETDSSYLYKTMVDGYAYACAPHLVLIKGIHCQTIDWDSRVR